MTSVADDFLATHQFFHRSSGAAGLSAAQRSFQKEVQNARLGVAVKWATVSIETLWNRLDGRSFPAPDERGIVQSVISYEGYRAVAMEFLKEKMEAQRIEKGLLTEELRQKGYLQSTTALQPASGDRINGAGAGGKPNTSLPTQPLDSERLEEAYLFHPILSPLPFLQLAVRPTARAAFEELQRKPLRHGRSAHVGSGNPSASEDADLAGAGLTENDFADYVTTSVLFKAMAKKILLIDMRYQLELVSSTSKPHCVCGDDMQEFLSKLLANLRLVRDMPPGSIPYYLCHATQRFFFGLDLRGCDEIPISTVLASAPFESLLYLYEPCADDCLMEFPPSAIVQISDPEALEQGLSRVDAPLLDAIVVSHEGSGTNAKDMYTIALCKPNPASQHSSNDESSGDRSLYAALLSSPSGEDSDLKPAADQTQGGNSPSTQLDRQQPTRLQLPRECLYYCNKTFTALPPDVRNEMTMNWFSLPVMLMLFEQFTQLDKDMDGYLTPEELSQYNNGNISPLAIQRVFDVHVRGQGGVRMDYSQFITFVLAMEYTSTKASQKYIWRLLDVHHTTDFVSAAVLRLFTKEVSKRLNDNFDCVISAESMVAELLDLVDPEKEDGLQWRDLERSKMSATVLPLFIDASAFHRYETREQQASSTQ
jgi:hypothetical protein